MAFSLSIQSAPEWRGDWTPPSAWSGGGTARPVITGRFTGRMSGAYTLFVVTGGTVGSTTTMRVDWFFISDTGASTTGRLDVGTDVGYSAGKKILFHNDLMIHFPGGLTLVAGDQSTFDVIAARRLPRAFHRIAGTGNPADVLLVSGARAPSDALFVSDAGDISVLSKRRGHAPTLQVVYQDNAAKRQIEGMESLRQPVMIGENYDADTVLLMRGGGRESLIGPVMTNARSSLGTYWDERSGQYRRAAINDVRTSPGVQLESDEGAGPENRNHIPLRYKHLGRALRVSYAQTANIQPNSHPAPLALGWATQAGAPTLTFEYGMLGVLDPDDPSWPDGFTQGVLKVHLDNTEAIETSLATVAGTTKYVASLWIRGRGNFAVALYGGAGVANTLRATLTEPGELNEDSHWHRLEGEVTTGGTDTRLNFRITCAGGDAMVYLSAASIVRSDYKQASIYEPSTTSIATRSAETYTIPDTLPQAEGTLQFWFQNTGDNQSSAFSIVDTLSGGRFAVRLDTSGTDNMEFHTDATGAANALQANVPGGTKIHEWRHVLVTWLLDGSGNLSRGMWIDGVSVGSDSTTNWEQWGLLTLFPTVASVVANDWCIQELRIDRRQLSQDEITDCYQRFTEDKWIHLQRLYAGREFIIGNIVDRWRHPQLPHIMIADVTLIESGVHESSAIGDP